ncbi:MAG: ABC transporter substrate-binding protein, partial [Alphaproteobacteria bacterium]|nr:ABC transporter substrate-binding protein [Alphaproteobacteria bacterium]
MRKRLWVALTLAGAIAWGGAIAQAADKVNVAEAGGAMFRLPFYIAVQNGYFKDEGLDLQIVETRTGSDSVKMLAGGTVDLMIGQLIDAVQIAKQGIPVRGVAMATNRITNSILVRSDLADQIRSLKDLKGQPYGVTGVGSGTWQFALYAAKQEGLQVDDLNIVGVGVNANVIAAMKSKRVAVLSYAEPETLMLVDD